MSTDQTHDGAGRDELLVPPAPPKIERSGENTTVDTLVAGDDLDAVNIAGLDLSDHDLVGVRITRFRMADAVTNGASFQGALLTDGELNDIEGTSIDLSSARLRDLVVRDSRIGAWDLHDTSLTRLHIQGCRLGFVNLRDATLEDVHLDDCVITDLDLGGASANRVAMTGCRIGRFVASSADLTHVDLRAAELDEIGAPTDLAGCTISPAQLARLAPFMAEHLKIRVASP